MGAPTMHEAGMEARPDDQGDSHQANVTRGRDASSYLTSETDPRTGKAGPS